MQPEPRPGLLGWWLVIAGALLVTACASGAAVRLPPAVVGPAPADAQLVVTLRQPLVSEVMVRLQAAGALPSQLAEDADSIGDATERIVFSLLPARRGAVIAFLPRTDYPAELIGWHLNVSDLRYDRGGDSGVRHYWSDPDIGFGILVFPNLIFSFWLDPFLFAAGATDDDPGPAVRERYGSAQCRRGHIVVADDPRHLFDQVLLDCNVRAPIRYPHPQLPSIRAFLAGVSSRLESQGHKRALDHLSLEIDAHHLLHTLLRDPCRSRLLPARVHVDDALARAAARDLQH